MKIAKTLMAAAAIASLASAPAFAGTGTRSSAALPSAVKFVPVSQVRAISKVKKSSNFTQTVVIPIIVGGMIVGYTTYEITTDDNRDAVTQDPAPLTGNQ